MSGPDLTADSVKQAFDQKTIKEATTFKPQGISEQAAKNYLETPEGKLYRQRLLEASPDTPAIKLQQRAIEHLTSGKELPRMETLHEPLVKIVPKGSEPSPYSPFWAKEADLDAAVKEGKNLSQHFALPVNSEAPQYDVYKITPKAPTEVFVNTVAPTSELGGQVTKPGGATQYLTPNRKLYEPAELVKTVDNRLHIPLQKTPVQRAPHSSPEAQATAHNAVTHVDGPRAHGIHATVKGVGIAGAVYGAYDGKQQVDAAIDTARSTREQWVRGAEESANVGARSVVTGVAATVGAIPGAAAGALTSPVTGPVGPVVGGLTTGSAAAIGAEKLYEDSRLQQWSKYLGREVGELGYDHISKEGRLLREVNSLKEELQTEANPQKREALEDKLAQANERFGVEAERNSRYFEARGGIEQGWEKIHTQYPQLDKDDVNDALDKHIDAGKRPAEAARAALSDAVHEKTPRDLPHHPPENYRVLSNPQLIEQHGQHALQLVQARHDVMALGANTDSRNNLDQGWPKELARQRHSARIENGLNTAWKEAGHVLAIRSAMQERGMQPPELPAELRARSGAATPAAPSSPAAQQDPRDAFRAQENRDRHNSNNNTSGPSEAPPISPIHQRQFDKAHAALAPGLSERGHSPEHIDRISAAAVGHAQQHAHRGDIQSVHLSKDGQRVAVLQESQPMGEYSVNHALTQSKDQHLEQAHAAATTQAREQSQEQLQAYDERAIPARAMG